MLETTSVTPPDSEGSITSLPISDDERFINFVNSGRRAFIAEAIGENQLGNLDLDPAYSPRERIGNLVRDLSMRVGSPLNRIGISIVNLNSRYVALSYIVFGAILFGSTIIVSCHPELLDRNEENKEIKIELIQNQNENVIKIKDNGCGIEEGKIDRIFDAFFTTKATGKGTGIGLTTVKSIVE